MAYEVHYHYYEKLENSFDYDREEKKSYKKVYGKVLEEYPLEKLAAHIQTQMARRDIFVFDIEIYEFAKKKITWRQNKSDFVIKNKKFSPTGVHLEDIKEDQDVACPDGMCHLPVAVAPPMAAVNLAPVLQRQVNLAQKSPVAAEARIIKKMVFMPGRLVSPVGYFTPEKEYPVYRESMAKNGIGMMIETIDDKGRKTSISDEYFVSSQQNLLGGEGSGFNSNTREDSRLNWNGVVSDQSPKLRT